MKYFNKTQIVSIELIDEKEIESIVYLEENKGFFGFGKIKEGFYKDPLLLIPLTKNPPNSYQKENTWFTKPHIRIIFSNDGFHSIFFNTKKEMTLYFKRNFQDLNLIADE